MLTVDINRVNFEYDINAIVRAFYPGEQVVVLTPETGIDKRNKAAEGDLIRICIREETAEYEYGQAPGAGIIWHENHKEWTYDPGEGKFKDCFKRFLYRFLREVTGRELPWGNLTGIRPTKIAYGMLENGCTEQEILDFYRKEHYVSLEKATLAIDIAKRERELLKDVHYEGGYSLYIGIPFCPTTCLYCSFTSYPIAAHRKMVDRYIDCVIKELVYTAENFKDKILDSVYVGGGTPTTLEPEQLDRLLSEVKRLFDFTHIKEFTVEAGRADSITREKLEVIKKYGVSRISVNPQTMNQRTLDIIGRKASVEQVREAYKIAREIGFDNINMDLILGLPGETEEDVRYTLDEVVKMAPDSLTVHSLAIKRASKLSKWIQENGVSALRNTDETMDIASDGARRLGLVPYYLYRQKNMSGNFENVGYAREGKLGLYNILIMEEMQTIIAVGAGSITKKVSTVKDENGKESVLIERCENVKEVAMYVDKIDEMIRRKDDLFHGKKITENR